MGKEHLISELITSGVFEKELSNSNLVQIIELCGDYLNIRTISQYAKDEGISYNGAKKRIKPVEIFGIKWIIENE